jgi:hypothetical protein
MATITKRKIGWSVQIRRKGYPSQPMGREETVRFPMVRIRKHPVGSQPDIRGSD